MFTYFFQGITCFIFYILLDKFIENYIYININNKKVKINGIYYLIHFINNMIITYLTYYDVILSYTDIINFDKHNTSLLPTVMTFSLHAYHTAIYYKKFRFDDWLHHILMCIVALPIAVLANGGILLNHSLFYLTGLPGGIDYFLLFLQRNNFINKITEKKINNYINLWLRCPGCIIHAGLTMVLYSLRGNEFTYLQSCFALITGLITYWNGIYFMNQVVVNYNMTLRKEKLK